MTFIVLPHRQRTEKRSVYDKMHSSMYNMRMPLDKPSGGSLMR